MPKKLFPVLFCLTILPAVHAAALPEIVRHGDKEVTVGGTMILHNIAAGLPAMSSRIAFTIDDWAIPDDAVVEKIAVVTGAVKVLSGTVVVDDYCLRGPGMASHAAKKWAGLNRETTYAAAELGGGDIPVKGEWNLYFTGNAISTRAPGSVSHRVVRARVWYRYWK